MGALNAAVGHRGEARSAARTALVTGASSGIGAAFAEVLAANGFDLIVTARRENRLAALAARIERDHGRRVAVMPRDLLAPGAVEGLCASLARTGTTVDALVNAAGFGIAGRFADASWAEHGRMLQAMAAAPAELTHRLLGPMVERGYGRIVNVASTAGLVDAGAGATYGATKAFVVSFSTALAREVRPHGVHVTAVCPGLTRTEFHDGAGLRATVARSPSWLWMDPAAVASAGYAAVMDGVPVVVPGLVNRAFVAAVRLAPRSLLVKGARAASAVARLRSSIVGAA